MAELPFVIYKGSNSPKLTPVVLTFKGVKYSTDEMATITRAYIKYRPTADGPAEYADSQVDSSIFDFSSDAADSKIKFDLGMLPLTAGSDPTAELVVFDTNHPQGRVVMTLNLEVSDEIYDGSPLSGATSMMSSVLDITDSKTLAVSELNQTVCLVAGTTKAILLPSVGASENGYYLDIVRGGAGVVTVTAADSDTIGNGTDTILTLEAGTVFGHVRIVYLHALTAWVVFRMGSIHGS